MREKQVRYAACACGAVRVHGQAATGAPYAAAVQKGELIMAASTHAIPQPRTRPGANAMPANSSVNVGDVERWLSLLGGGLLALYMLRRSLGTIVLLGGAGVLLYRGLKGQCPLYQTMGLSTVAHDLQPASPRSVAGPDEESRIVLASS